MSKKELRVVYSESERIDPLWYVLMFLVFLEVLAILLILLMSFLSSNPMSTVQILCLLAITNLFNTVIGVVTTALIFRRRERQTEPQLPRGPVVLTAEESQNRLPQYEPSKYELPAPDRSRSNIDAVPDEPKLQLPASAEDGEP